MSIRRNHRFSFMRFVAPLATMLLLGYFGFHAFNGHYGVRAHLVMQSRIEMLESRLAERTKQRKLLESRVALLDEGSMERDTVDEHIRRQLNMARNDEIVLIH